MPGVSLCWFAVCTPRRCPELRAKKREVRVVIHDRTPCVDEDECCPGISVDSVYIDAFDPLAAMTSEMLLGRGKAFLGSVGDGVESAVSVDGFLLALAQS